jgi:hypothetical protein
VALAQRVQRVQLAHQGRQQLQRKAIIQMAMLSLAMEQLFNGANQVRITAAQVLVFL